MNIRKAFDIVFFAGAVVWIMFAVVLPTLFNMDNDVTLWMVYLTIFLGVYGIGRLIVKFFQKEIDKID